MRRVWARAVAVIASAMSLVLAVPPAAHAYPQITERVSFGPDGAPSDGPTTAPSISRDGRYVVYQSSASNHVDADPTPGLDIHLLDRDADGDRVTGEFVGTRPYLVSATPLGAPGNAQSYGPRISHDGGWVLFTSDARDLVPGDGNARSDVFVWERRTRAITRVSVDAAGGDANAASGDARPGAISDGGRIVAFTTRATDIAGGTGARAVIVRDLLSQGTCAPASVRVPLPEPLADATWTSAHSPALSADGTVLAFVAQTANGGVDVFRATVAPCVPGGAPLQVLASALVSRTLTGDPSLTSIKPDVSADGSTIAFESVSSLLVPGDANGRLDVFVADAGGLARASISNEGRESNGSSYGASLSADGGAVAFVSTGSNLTPDDGNEIGDVFVHARTLAGGRRVPSGTQLVSIMPGGLRSSSLAYAPAFASAGREVAFTGRPPGLPYTEILVRDRARCADGTVKDGPVSSRVIGGTSFLPGVVHDAHTFTDAAAHTAEQTVRQFLPAQLVDEAHRRHRDVDREMHTRAEVLVRAGATTTAFLMCTSVPD